MPCSLGRRSAHRLRDARGVDASDSVDNGPCWRPSGRCNPGLASLVPGMPWSACRYRQISAAMTALGDRRGQRPSSRCAPVGGHGRPDSHVCLPVRSPGSPDHADPRRASHRRRARPARRRRLGQARRRIRQEEHGRGHPRADRVARLDRVRIVGHDIGLMVAYAYAAQFPQATERVVLMDAFLPGIGDWKSVWLLRDLWHFHFYGDVPLALVKGRERIYLEHFWNDFAADRNAPCPRPIAGSTPGPTRSPAPCARASSTSAISSATRRTSPGWGHAAVHAGAGPVGREGGRHVPHRAGQAGRLRRPRPGRHGRGPLADGGSARHRDPRHSAISSLRARRPDGLYTAACLVRAR